MSARATPSLPESPAIVPAVLRGIAACAATGALLLAAGCAELPRDVNGSPPTARLAPNAIPPAPLTADDKQKLDTLNQQILREQAAAIALDQQAAAARAAYGHPKPSWNLYYGGWGCRHWGGGAHVRLPGLGLGGVAVGRAGAQGQRNAAVGAAAEFGRRQRRPLRGVLLLAVGGLGSSPPAARHHQPYG